MASIRWLPWGAEPFARARAERKPVLLAIVPGWCACSQRMDRTTYRDADVCSLVGSRFVPIRVDPDRRPDVSERYALGGWPTTAFLTGDGEILGGGTYVDAERLRHTLERVSEAFGARRDFRHPPRRGGVPPPRPGSASIESLIALVVDQFDPVHGGFGGRPKFPHVAPVRLAIELYKQTGGQHYYDIAIRSLDAMAWGPLYDEEQGGFFSYSQEADWSRPNRAKRLDVNASLLSLYISGLEVLGQVRYGDRAEGILRYAQTWLADPVDGGWAGSQRASGGPDGDASSPADAGEELPVDPTLFCDWNATMASAALHAGRVLDDRALSEFAIKSLERVLLLCYRPGSGVAHYVEEGAPQVRGLLDDQVAMTAAALDAFEATGDVVYRMMAQELAACARRSLWDAEAGGFVDRIIDPRRDVGLLKRPLKPFAPNCIAARVLWRVAGAPGSAELAADADRILALMAPRAWDEGPLVAEYVLSRMFRPGQ